MAERVAPKARLGLRTKVIVLLASLTLALALVEIALRIAHYKPSLSSAWILGYSFRMVDDDVVTIDRRFVDDAFYRPFRDLGQTKLIVTLGDSFTASFPVEEKDSYPRVLEQTLKERTFGVRVLNVGMGDTGPDQQLKLFEKYVLPRVHPDIVVWQLYPNDTYENVIKAVYSMGDDGVLVPITATDNWMYRRQKFFDALPLPIPTKRSSYLINVLLRQYERGREAKVPEGKDKLEWGRKKIEREIDRMNQLAAQHGFTAYYTLVAPEAVYRADVPTGSIGAVEAVEFDRLLAIVDRQPTFIRGRFWSPTLEDSQLAATLFDNGTRDPSPYGTRHLNEAGYRLLADGIANRLLKDNGLRPSQTTSETGPVGPIELHLGDGSARRYLRRGWQLSESEGGHIWSQGLQSVLDVPLPKGVDVRMDFECRPLVYPGSPQQTISVVLNGKPIQQLTLEADKAKYSVTLPAAVFGDWPDTIELNYGYAQRPMDVISGSTDQRSLAVVWYSIDFTPIR
jgi:hypothetical protein